MLPSYLLHGTVVKKTMGQEGMSMGVPHTPWSLLIPALDNPMVLLTVPLNCPWYIT
jgi:hypothetical protein